MLLVPEKRGAWCRGLQSRCGRGEHRPTRQKLGLLYRIEYELDPLAISPCMESVIVASGREFVALRKSASRESLEHPSAYHAVTPFCRIALCCTEPGVKSGWAEPPAAHVTCRECLRRLTRLSGVA